MIIYQLTNTINNKSYIGLTTKTLEVRWRRHVQDANAGSRGILHKAIRKYGLTMFDRKVIGETDHHPFLLMMEQVFIKNLKTQAPNGYNLTAGGEGLTGLIFTPEHRLRLSKSQIGNKKAAGCIRSSDYLRKMSARLLGRTYTAETLRRMSDGQRGNKNLLGHKHSADTKQKFRDAWVRRKQRAVNDLEAATYSAA